MKRLLPLKAIFLFLLVSFSTKNEKPEIQNFTIETAKALEGPVAPLGTIPFITTWKTDNPGVSANNQITIPTHSLSTYNYTVDWGDGNITTNHTGNATHTYLNPSTYTVSITGLFPRIFFGGLSDEEKILTIEQWGDNQWTTMNAAFEDCINLQGNFTDSPDLSNVTDMSRMFTDASSFNYPIGNWNTSNVTNMRSLFFGATAFNQDIDSWDVSSVTTMAYIFRASTSFNQDISNWDVSNVSIMDGMFFGAESFNQDIGPWDVSSATTMDELFRSATAFNQDIGGWNVTNVTGMQGVFSRAENFNQDISGWDVANVTDMRTMFLGAIVFNQDIGGWQVANVTDMSDMFLRATAFNQNIGGWDVSSVTRMQSMFFRATSFNQNLSTWNTGNVTNTASMFYEATSFDQDLGDWNVSNVIYMSNMFRNVTLSTPNYDALLIGWNAQSLQPNNNFHGGNSRYCAGASARANMMASDGWLITDNGPANITIDALADQNHALSYMLPLITGPNLTSNQRYYTGPLGTGTAYAENTILNHADFPSYPVTIYIYDETGTSPNCSDEQSFALTLTPPGLSVSVSASATEKCDTDTSAITLSGTVTPTTAIGTYSYAWYEQGNPVPLGTNTTFDVTPFTATTYVLVVTDDGLPAGSNSATGTATIDVIGAPQIAPIANVTECISYRLPVITGTNLSGSAVYEDALGNIYLPNTDIDVTTFSSYPQTLFVRDQQTGTTVSCSDEISFTITITGMPMPFSLSDVNACDSFTLPDLPTNTRYFDQMGAMGTEYFANDVITSNMTLYIYAGVPGCSAETDFDITLDASIPVSEMEDIQVCENYVLPEITAGSYFTQSQGQGTELFAFGVINSTQTIYIYNEAGACTAESNFTVTVDCSPPAPTTCVSFPKFVSANFDGTNDFFAANNDASCTVNGIVSIFDRYGKLLIQFNAANDHWDGTYNGMPVQSTDYWYRYVDIETGAVVKGHFSLKR